MVRIESAIKIVDPGTAAVSIEATPAPAALSEVIPDTDPLVPAAGLPSVTEETTPHLKQPKSPG